MKIELCCNSTIGIVAICVAIIGSVSIHSGHDGLEMVLAVESALAGLTQIPRKSNGTDSAASTAAAVTVIPQ